MSSSSWWTEHRRVSDLDQLSDPYAQKYAELAKQRAREDSYLENDTRRLFLEQLNQHTTQLYIDYVHARSEQQAMAFACFFHLNNLQQIIRHHERSLHTSGPYSFRYTLDMVDHHNHRMIDAELLEEAKRNLYLHLNLIHAPLTKVSVPGSPLLIFTRIEPHTSEEKQQVEQSLFTTARQSLQGNPPRIENAVQALQAWAKVLPQVLYNNSSHTLRQFLNGQNFTALENTIMYGSTKAYAEGTFTTTLQIENNQQIAIELCERLNTYGSGLVTAQAYSLANRPDLIELEIVFRK